MTIAVTGLLRNIFEEFIYSLFFRRTGLDRSAIPQFLYPFGDHRIAMSFAIASLRAAGAIEIRDVANVATSFPGFVGLACSAGLDVRESST